MGGGAGRLLLGEVGRRGLVPFEVSPFVFKEDSCLSILLLGAAAAGFLLEGVRKKLATWGAPC